MDHALVQPATIARLIDASRRHPGRICHPCVTGVRGQRPLIPIRLVQEIIGSSGKAGLRKVLQRWGDLALDVKVADRGTLLDSDTPEDLAGLQQSSRRA